MAIAQLLAQNEPTKWTDWLPAVGAVVLTVVAISVIRTLIQRTTTADRSEVYFRVQIATIALVLGGIVAVIFVLPESFDSELAFSVVGLVVTGALAISSQSIIANAMAGIMLRSVSSFRPGDFIEVSERMGRVSEMGLFHTEIQTADRDLVTLPNSLMVNHPVRVVRSSGTIVSTEVSLGYDASRHDLEVLFVKAAEAADLVDPFVQVIELGNYAVTYRVAGFLADPRSLLASRSKLQGAILDTLSVAGVEILSPMYVSRRSVSEESVLPRFSAAGATASRRRSAEDRVFDKAEAAGQLEESRSELVDALENLDLLKIELGHADEDTMPRVRAAITRQEHRIARLEKRIERLTEQREEA